MNEDMTILVVDDFSTMRRIIKNLLRELGYKNVFEADDGVSALRILQKTPVNLVITDWNMPQMSGLELLRAIRATKNLKHLPVLMATAEAKREQIIQAVEAGVNAYIVKPFNGSTLEEKIHRIGDRVQWAGHYTKPA
ncbi:chemotaxis response regulator CheY [Pseudomonas migulae]|uniref:Two-component system, chemotaxis family, response regulator CheY n=1 Tax=Pseudomonas migulae TaxID=78543 RepID=A0A1H5H8U9_9PSED|nr:chemotaxis response regulator CheY [Pseudomonas migulae]SEE24379.1 two-component system, chemotaxis family, response regulator CheY [Pseudomonas migulae]